MHRNLCQATAGKKRLHSAAALNIHPAPPRCQSPAIHTPVFLRSFAISGTTVSAFTPFPRAACQGIIDPRGSGWPHIACLVTKLRRPCTGRVVAQKGPGEQGPGERQAPCLITSLGWLLTEQVSPLLRAVLPQKGGFLGLECIIFLTITYFQYVLQSLRALGAAEAPQQCRSVAAMKPLPPPAPRAVALQKLGAAKGQQKAKKVLTFYHCCYF